MKNTKLIFALFAMIAINATLFGQNGNAVVSSIDVEDLGNGTGMIVVKISGNLAHDYTGGTFIISGDRIAGGSAGGGLGTESRVIVQPPIPGNGKSNGNQQVLLAGLFPITSESGNSNDDVQMSFRWPRNGIDWTYSRVGRIRRPTGI